MGGFVAVNEEVGHDVMNRWETILTGLESDPTSLSAQLDWVAKKRLLDAYRERQNLDWGDARLAALALQYHDVRPERSVFAKLGMESLVSPADAEAGVSNPPEDTRAYFRGTCLRRWAEDIVAANWDSLVFDLGAEPLRRVPMMEPGRGTRAHVEQLFDTCERPADLLAALDSTG
jgi:hypothetical protein